MRTTQLVAHNGALQCNANRLRCPVNEGTRKPRSDARLTSHTFFESHRLEDLEVLERRLAKLAVGLNREGDEVVAKLVARLAILVSPLGCVRPASSVSSSEDPQRRCRRCRSRDFVNLAESTIVGASKLSSGLLSFSFRPPVAI